jgi:hypothetical protein
VGLRDFIHAGSYQYMAQTTQICILYIELNDIFASQGQKLMLEKLLYRLKHRIPSGRPNWPKKKTFEIESFFNILKIKN